MGVHERLEEQERDDRLPQEFVAMCAATWAKYRQPRDLLARAMLAASINMLIEDGEPAEVAHILAGLAVQIAPTEVAGHG